MSAHNLTIAEAKFEAAAAWAGDGAIVTAATLAREALAALEREWNRRRAAGMPGMAAGTFQEAVAAEIARRPARGKAAAR